MSIVVVAGQIPAATPVTQPDGSVAYVAEEIVIPCSWDASTLYLSSGPTAAARVYISARNASTGTWSQVGGTGGQDGVLLSPGDSNHKDFGPASNINTWVLRRIPNGPGDTMQAPVGYELRQNL